MLLTDRFTRRSPRRTALAAALAATLATTVMLGASGAQPATAAPACGISNPVVAAGADPSVWYRNGKYYLAQSDGARSINLRASTTIGGLRTATPRTIWTSPVGTDHSAQTWAPEIEYLAGKWIIYFAAAREMGSFEATNNTHRIFAITANTQDPMGSWSYFGKIADSTNQWAIDATVFYYAGSYWMLWSGTPTGNGGAPPQQLYIAHMSDPLRIDQDYRRLIANPDQPWETSVAAIEEGPEAFISPTGKLTILYNANASWTSSYAIAGLVHNGGPLTTYTSYAKRGPLLTSGNGVYGPGGMSLVVPGTYGGNWLVYHANTSSSGSWNTRAIYTQPQTWNADGTPNFGTAPAGKVSYDENTGRRC